MVYLGIDYGRKKVGLALAEGPLAWPLVVLPNKKNLLEKISQNCQEQLVDEIIIGLPEGELEKEVKSFGEKLRQLTGLLVEFVPEVLTTQEAIDKMISVKKRRKTRRAKEDAFASAIILQNFLDNKKG